MSVTLKCDLQSCTDKIHTIYILRKEPFSCEFLTVQIILSLYCTKNFGRVFKHSVNRIKHKNNRKKCFKVCALTILVCFEPLGVANGLIPDTAITASSSLDDNMRPYNGRVLKASSSKTASRGCWCARKSDTAQYLQVDLRRNMAVTGTAERV